MAIRGTYTRLPLQFSSRDILTIMSLILFAILLYIPLHLSGWSHNYISTVMARGGILVAADAVSPATSPNIPLYSLGLSTFDLDQTEDASNGDFELEQDTCQEWQFTLLTFDALMNSFTIDIRQAMRFVRKIAIASQSKQATQDAKQNQVFINTGRGPKTPTTATTPAFSAAEMNNTMAASQSSFKAAALQIIRSAKSIEIAFDEANIQHGLNEHSRIFKSSAQFESRFQFEFNADSQSEFRDTSGNELSFA